MNASLLDLIAQPNLAADPFLQMGLGLLGSAYAPRAPLAGASAGLNAASQAQAVEMQNMVARTRMQKMSQEMADKQSLLSYITDPSLRAMASVAPEQFVTGFMKNLGAAGGGTWEGSGFRAQAANIYNELMGIVNAGGTLTPEQQTNLRIAHQHLTAPKAYTTAEGTYMIPGVQGLPLPPGVTGPPAFAPPGASGAPAPAAGIPGAPAPAPGVPGFTPKPPTESERKTRSFYERASASATELARLEEEGYDPSAMKPGIIRDYLGSRLKEDPSALVSLFGSALTSPQADLYSTAAGDFIASMLRYDSGAAVPETEFARYYSTYFPIPGDGPETRIAKNARRAAVVRALQIASGRALTAEQQRQEIEWVTQMVEEQIPLPEKQSAAESPAAPAPAARKVIRLPDDPETGERVFGVDF